MAQAPKKPSKVEGLKVGSDYLRAPLAAEMTDPAPSITEDAVSILKFHGSYQQDDRDLRTQLRREGKDKAFTFMVRVRIPGGKLANARQYLACDQLARELGNGTLRITTRQEFQFHGVLKRDAKAVVRRINEVWLSTLAACGDVERNVLCCPAPLSDRVRAEMQEDCDTFAVHFAPRSNAYYEIWLDGEKIPNPLLPEPGPSLVPTAGDTDVEPIYGAAYLPRKFKTAFALPDDNCTDVHANDLGYLAIVEDGRVVGYNVLVGGGLGTTPSAGKTFPFLAVPLCYVPRGPEILRVGEAIIKAYRDLGDRSDRKRARLKYVITDLGLPAFRAKVDEYLGTPTADPKPVVVRDVHDHLGWIEQGDGKLSLGLPIENGRIKDEGNLRIATGLRTLFECLDVPARLTCSQSILLINIDPEWRAEIDRIVAEHGIPTVETTSTVRRWAMACPALPTCGLAVTEAERALPGVMDELEDTLDDLGLAAERFTVRMTGCPNGCARPYNADIGLVGRSAAKNADGTNNAGTYTIFLGGSTAGTRLNKIFKDYVPYDQIVTELRPLFERYREEREPGEGFGDFCHRVGVAVIEPEETAAEA
jgi:sulfite reductase (ferredoxin)